MIVWVKTFGDGDILQRCFQSHFLATVLRIEIQQVKLPWMVFLAL